MRVLITCPPMLGMMEEFAERFRRASVETTCPPVVQTLSVEELLQLVPAHDGWIIGDDPATRAVFAAGSRGKLRAAVKWGIGVDNVDFAAAKEFGIAITNTPNMFGAEVADVATCYVIGLARELFWIDRQVRNGEWVKPCGSSLQGKRAALIGYGDIGKNVAKRLAVLGMDLIVYDPVLQGKACEFPTAEWPRRLDEVDYLVFTCALTKDNRHMLNAEVLRTTQRGVRVVNCARGPLIDEAALVEALLNGWVHSAALDVFETEPLPLDSPLRKLERCILGTHNGSNTREAVQRASEKAIAQLFGFLGVEG
jgi:D-3-phosphoglycerate dehydrogenase / 2-oxoglutarate reductase